MTELDNNDKLLHDFFAQNKQEIADNGFSRRVMHHLPDQSNWQSHIWTSCVMIAAIVLFFRMDGLEAIGRTLREVFIGMLQYQEAHLDPKSLIIAAVVLLFLGTRKLVSMA